MKTHDIQSVLNPIAWHHFSLGASDWMAPLINIQIGFLSWFTMLQKSCYPRLSLRSYDMPMCHNFCWLHFWHNSFLSRGSAPSHDYLLLYMAVAELIEFCVGYNNGDEWCIWMMVRLCTLLNWKETNIHQIKCGTHALEIFRLIHMEIQYYISLVISIHQLKFDSFVSNLITGDCFHEVIKV